MVRKIQVIVVMNIWLREDMPVLNRPEKGYRDTTLMSPAHSNEDDEGKLLLWYYLPPLGSSFV